MMYHIMKTGFTISIVDYYGIEPAPLKFVYFNFLKYISEHSITINYNMIDRAVVFDDAKTIPLRYGENNFGHFNVAGSNYANIDAAEKQSALESVSLSVETIPFSDVIRLLKASKDHDAIIVKIDCKNRTDQMFRAILDELSNCQQRYLLSCERDGSGDRDLSEYVRRGMNVLSTSRTDRPPGL
jgi:hypothetical protein